MKKRIISNITKANNANYEQNYQISPLKLMIIIVNRYQSNYFLDAFEEIGISCGFVTYGKGTATSDILKILGIGEDRKDIMFLPVPNSKIAKCKKIIEERFAVSEEAKGVSFCIPFDSMVSVLAYKFLTDTKRNKKRSKENE